MYFRLIATIKSRLTALDFYGTRRHTSSFILAVRHHRSDGLLRLTISKLNRFLNAVLFSVRIRDANVPFRLIKTTLLADVLREVPQGVFAPNIFLSILAARRGIELTEIAVPHAARETGEESIRRLKLLRACSRSAKELIAFRIALYMACARRFACPFLQTQRRK